MPKYIARLEMTEVHKEDYFHNLEIDAPNIQEARQQAEIVVQKLKRLDTLYEFWEDELMENDGVPSNVPANRDKWEPISIMPSQNNTLIFQLGQVLPAES